MRVDRRRLIYLQRLSPPPAHPARPRSSLLGSKCFCVFLATSASIFIFRALRFRLAVFFYVIRLRFLRGFCEVAPYQIVRTKRRRARPGLHTAKSGDGGVEFIVAMVLPMMGPPPISLIHWNPLGKLRQVRQTFCARGGSAESAVAVFAEAAWG